MRLLTVLSILFLISCGSKPVVAVGRASTKYAKHFRIVEHKDFTELQIMQPETGKLEKSYALVHKEDKVEVPSGMTIIEVPVKSLAALSTTNIGMLAALEELDCIKGTTDATYIANAKVLRGIRSGKIASFTDEGSIRPEKLMSKKIGLIVYSGFGKDFTNADKLEKLGVICMANYEWREEHPLGKAEWIKVFGYLTDQPEKSFAYFDQVEKSYNETRTAILQTGKEHPSVLAGSVIGGIWYAPAGESYIARILEDAGADYLYKNEKGTGSCEKTFEKVYRDQQNADFWINPDAVSLQDLIKKQEKYGLFSPVKKGHVYCYTHNGNYFWEMSAVNPHWILSDYVSIFGTGKKSKLHFYKKLN